MRSNQRVILIAAGIFLTLFAFGCKKEAPPAATAATTAAAAASGAGAQRQHHGRTEFH